MHRSHETVPTIPAWLVCDRCIRREIRPRPHSARAAQPAAAHRERLSGRSRHARCARRQDRRRCGGPARHRRSGNNRFAETGDDEDFGKGSTEFDRHNGDPHHGPNPCLGPIETPPYYAMAVYPSTLGSSVGLQRRRRRPRARRKRRADSGPVRLRQRHGVDHARHTIRGRASRSGRRWCSAIAPRWRSRARAAGAIRYLKVIKSVRLRVEALVFKGSLVAFELF